MIGIENLVDYHDYLVDLYEQDLLDRLNGLGMTESEKQNTLSVMRKLEPMENQYITWRTFYNCGSI